MYDGDFFTDLEWQFSILCGLAIFRMRKNKAHKHREYKQHGNKLRSIRQRQAQRT